MTTVKGNVLDWRIPLCGSVHIRINRLPAKYRWGRRGSKWSPKRLSNGILVVAISKTRDAKRRWMWSLVLGRTKLTWGYLG